MSMAEKIKLAISKSGLKQRYVAERVGISEQTLSYMLCGRQKIDVETFMAIAVVLHMTPNEISELQSA